MAEAMTDERLAAVRLDLDAAVAAGHSASSAMLWMCVIHADDLFREVDRLRRECDEARAAVARVEAERTDLWDEGYEACLNDTEQRSAPPGPNGPPDPTSNPYPAAPNPTRATCAGE